MWNMICIALIWLNQFESDLNLIKALLNCVWEEEPVNSNKSYKYEY